MSSLLIAIEFLAAGSIASAVVGSLVGAVSATKIVNITSSEKAFRVVL